MNIEIPLEVAGYLRAEVVRDGEVVLDTGFTPNMITDLGLAFLGTGPHGAIWCARRGTGSTPPAASDTSLVSQEGPVAYRGGIDGGTGDGYGYARCRFDWPAATEAANLTEFGVYDEAETMLWARALFRDAGGTPIVISLQTGDILRVTYEVRNYWPAEAVSSITVKGVATEVRVCPANHIGGNAGIVWGTNSAIANRVRSGNPFGRTMNFYTGGYNPNQVAPTGDYIGGVQVPVGASPVGNSTRVTVPVGVNSANGNIGALEINLAGGAYQVGFSPAITKTASEVMTIAFTLSWGRRT